MKKIYGAEGRKDGLYQVGRGKYEAVAGFGSDELGCFNYRERYCHRPSIEEMRSDYNEAVNEDVQEKILKGMEYQGHLVWLDAESQRNYMAKAVQIQGGANVFPVEVKLGTDENPHFHVFETADEYLDFFNAVTEHITNAQSEGWEDKMSVAWSDFEDVKEVCHETSI